MSNKRYDVCASVVSHLPYDARAWKQARSLAEAGYSIALLGCRYDEQDVLERVEYGVDVVEIPFGNRRSTRIPAEKLWAVARLWARILATPARVYHVHNIHTAPPAWLASRLRGSALVYDGHELYGEQTRPGILPAAAAHATRAIERFMVRKSDAVVTTNPSKAEVLTKRHGRNSIQVLHNVPPTEREVTPLDPGFPKGVPVLLYQGGIYPESRAFREMIQALALLDRVELVILGFGQDATVDTVRRWTEEAGVAERVHFLPPRPFGELVRTAAAATVGIVPIKPDSLGAYLGDTNKLHEYLMAGLPVVASDLPEIRRVATEGDPPVGEVFDPSSPESIADAVRRVLEDPVRYEARRREARRLALERFNWEAEEGRLLALYEGVT